MTEKRVQPEPKKNLTLADAHNQLLDFFDHNPEIAAFYPDIVQQIVSKPVSLPESRVVAPIRKPIIINDRTSNPVHPADIPHSGKNRT